MNNANDAVIINKRTYTITRRESFGTWERVVLTSKSGIVVKSAIFIDGKFDCWEGGKDTRKTTMGGANRSRVNWRG